MDGFKSSLNFRDLQIIELLFYCHLSNKDVAKVMSISEKNVALIKHRSLKRIHENVSTIPFGPSSEDFENLMTDIWKLQRFGCPKRSTIGAFYLDTPLVGNVIEFSILSGIALNRLLGIHHIWELL